MAPLWRNTAILSSLWSAMTVLFSLFYHFLKSYRIKILIHSIPEERLGRAASTATATSEACCRSETRLVSPWLTVDTFRCPSAPPIYGFGRVEGWCDRARAAQRRRVCTYTHLDPQTALYSIFSCLDVLKLL
jgi:hypothetical protein